MFSSCILRYLTILLATTAICASNLAANEIDRDFWTVTFENDMLGDGNDGHYTHGTQISRFSSHLPGWLQKISERFPCGPCRDTGAVKYEFGQNIYTPYDTSRATIVVEDRPYAGWLYLGARLMQETELRNSTRTDTVGLKLGVVGPASMADRTQEFFHKRRNLRMPRGWQHQLENEPGFVLDYTRSWRRGPQQRYGLGADTTPYISGAVGNVHTYLAGGVTFRAGFNLNSGDMIPLKSTGSWNLFVSLEGRAVVRNIFLDGNSWVESHSVDKRPFVGELGYGLSYTGKMLDIRFVQIVRSREFYGQHEPDHYGSVSFTYRP